MKDLPKWSSGWYRAAASLAALETRMAHHDRLCAIAETLTASPPSTVAGTTAWARVSTLLRRAGEITLADRMLDGAESALSNVAAQDPMATACVLHARANKASFQGDLGASLALREDACRHAESTGDLRFACTQKTNVALSHLELGACEAAERELRDVVARAESLGLHDLALGARSNLGLALARSGALTEARATILLALKESFAQHNRRLEAGSRIYLAMILHMLKDPRGAAQMARAALAISSSPSLRANALAVLARALSTQALGKEALSTAMEAMMILRSTAGVEEGEMMIRLAHIEALLASRSPEVRDAIQSGYLRLTEKAQKIGDPHWRKSFLQKVPENAEIVRLAAITGAAPGRPDDEDTTLIDLRRSSY